MQFTMEKTSNFVTLHRNKLLLSMCLVATFLLSFRWIPNHPKNINGNYQLISTIPLEANFITTDFLKNAYIINKKNQVMKYDSTGALINIFSENKYGQLHSIDATSPFNVLLFYKDNATVVSTDMKLNTRRLYKLSSVGINNVSTVCLSSDNYIWVFDTDDQRLKKIDANYQVIQKSIDMRKMLGESITPNFLIEKDGLVYLNIPNQGLILFDILGTYYTSIMKEDITSRPFNEFQVVNNRIIYYDNTYLSVYDIVTKEPEWIAIPNNTDTQKVRVERGRLYILNKTNLQFYAQVK